MYVNIITIFFSFAMIGTTTITSTSTIISTSTLSDTSISRGMFIRKIYNRCGLQE